MAKMVEVRPFIGLDEYGRVVRRDVEVEVPMHYPSPEKFERVPEGWVSTAEAARSRGVSRPALISLMRAHGYKERYLQVGRRCGYYWPKKALRELAANEPPRLEAVPAGWEKLPDAQRRSGVGNTCFWRAVRRGQIEGKCVILRHRNGWRKTWIVYTPSVGLWVLTRKNDKCL